MSTVRAVSCVAVLCLAHILATLQHGSALEAWKAVLEQNTSLQSVLVNIKYLCTYAGLVIPGEAAARLMSLTALCCNHSATWLKWPNVNIVWILLEGGLLLRALKLTYDVIRKKFVQITFTERELTLFKNHFEKHGLSQREFRELLDAGAEWHVWPAVDAQKPSPSRWERTSHALTLEGMVAPKFILIRSGSCSVVHAGVEVARLGAGDLVGEMSFARRISDHLSDAGTKTVSRASVLPVDAVEYVAWPAKQLAQHVFKSVYAKSCLLTIIAAAQARKLDEASSNLRRVSTMVQSSSAASLTMVEASEKVQRISDTTMVQSSSAASLASAADQ